MTTPRTVAFKTLGCRLNQYETDALMTDFVKAGYRVVELDAGADVSIVNTCTVTNEGDRKSRGGINQAVRGRRNGGIVIVTGCMANSQRAYLEDRADITYVVPNASKNAIRELADAHFRGELAHPEHLQPGRFDFNTGESGIHTRSAIKIQDGCDNFCTYCIVPSVRGRAESRPAGDILDHVRRALDTGSRELVLTGVNIGRYEHDGVRFEDLVARILGVPGDFRVRLSSLEPDGFGDGFTALFANPKLCPHLHLCLQSGSDRMLMRMRRFYTVAQYRRLIERFRTAYPRFNFTTDIIVGFPGETDADFAATLEVAEACGFSHIHTFPYSQRDGTRAARMPDPVPAAEKRRRGAAVRHLSAQLKRRYRESLVGQAQRLLVERVTRGQARGYGEHYVPIALPARGLAVNAFADVRLTGIRDDATCTLTAAP